MSSKLASRPRTTSTALPSLHCEIDGTPYKTPGRTLVCVTHVCHTPRHAPIYRRIMRFLLWRWGESNQSGGIATKNGGTSRFAPLQRHKHARRPAPKSVTPASLVVTHAHMQTMERYSHLTEHLPYFLDGRTTVFSSLVLCGASAL